MGTIKMTRVDARLVHGQVAVSWTNACAAAKIVVIDDDTAADPFLNELFQLSAPSGVVIETYNISDGVAMWEKDRFGDGNIIVLFKTVGAAYKAFNSGAAFTALNIGQSPKEAGRRQIYNTVYLNDEEMKQLTELSEKGVEVYFHSVPEDRKLTLKEVR